MEEEEEEARRNCNDVARAASKNKTKLGIERVQACTR